MDFYSQALIAFTFDFILVFVDYENRNSNKNWWITESLQKKIIPKIEYASKNVSKKYLTRFLQINCQWTVNNNVKL